MSKSFNVQDNVINALRGFVKFNPSVELLEEERVVYLPTNKSGKSTRKVAILSGGGSGHEPTHAGFVGIGCLNAAVCGDIFSSPSTKQIMAGIESIYNYNNEKEEGKGVLLIVKNYTGDILHFGLAAERARGKGINVETVVIGDDVSVGRKKGDLVGRRGLAGTVLVHKIVGGAILTIDNLNLKDTVIIARSVNNNLITIGASLNHCHVPGHKFEINLKDNEIEIGMGIHNESGVEKLSPIPNIGELISNHLLPKLLSSKDKDRYFVPFDAKVDKFVLLINNLGGISNLDVLGISEITTKILKFEYNIIPVKTIVGTFMTALDGPGFSITLLNITRANNDINISLQNQNIDILKFLEAPTTAPGWINISKGLSHDERNLNTKDYSAKHDLPKAAGKFDKLLFIKLVKSGINKLIIEENISEITKYDTIAGDGDCGETLKNGGQAILKAFKDEQIPFDSATSTVSAISDIIESSMGGTSGGLYSIFLTGLIQGIQKTNKDHDQITTSELSKSLEIGLETLYKYTLAKPGDRTLIDSLEPFVKEFSKSRDFSKAVLKSGEGVEKTKQQKAKFGRASYVNDDILTEEVIPDPGAYGLHIFLEGVKEGLE